MGKRVRRRLTRLLNKHAVRNWRNAPRMWSVVLSLSLSAMSGIWLALPAFQDLLPAHLFAATCVSVSLLICIGRLVRQPGIHDTD